MPFKLRTIAITQEDIDQGQAADIGNPQGRASTCPLAQAYLRITGEHYLVGYGQVQTSTEQWAKTTDTMRQFINRADAHRVGVQNIHHRKAPAPTNMRVPVWVD